MLMRHIELGRDFTRRFPKCVYVVDSPSLPGRYVYYMYAAYSFSMKKKKGTGMRNYTKRQVARENYSRHFLSFFSPFKFSTHTEKKKRPDREKEK